MAKTDKIDLKNARERMVSDRRSWAIVLAERFDRTKTPEARREFLEVQQVIEAIDRAAKDESEGEASKMTDQ